MEPSTGPRELRFGPFAVELRSGELRKNGTRIRLQEKPLRVLALLAERQGELVTREELKKHLWPEETFVDFETGLNTAVKKLRGALADDPENPRFIETIPRRGYRFVAEVEFHNGHRPASLPAHNPDKAEPAAQEERAVQVSPSSAEPGQARVPKAKSLLPAMAWASLVVVIVLVLGLGYWMTHARAALYFHSRDSVLIADFENQTGDPRFDTALGTAFHVSMEQSRYANVFPRMQLESVLKRMGKPPNERITPALGREICQREGVRGLIVNSITRTGQEYALTAELIDPVTGQTVRSYTEHSHGDDHILDAMDVLSKDMREALGESLYEIQQANKRLPQVTTSSLSALKQYADGMALWHRGEYKDAVPQLKAAVATDPDFAMAHAALGDVDYSYISNLPDDGKKEFEKALALSERTTDRERMIIETEYAADRGHGDEAERLYRNYLNRYPDDATMRLNFGNLLRNDKRDAEAIEQYKKVLQTVPDFAHAYIEIATAEKKLNNFPAAIQAYTKAFEIDPHWLIAGNVNREYGFTLVETGEYGKAAQVFAALLAKPETRENGLRSLAFLDLYLGKYSSAKSRCEQSLEILKPQIAPLSLARVHLLLAIVAKGQGDLKGQRENLDAALAELRLIQPKVVIGAMIGDAFVRAGALDKAEKIAQMITPLADPHNPEHMGYLHLLEGEIALARNENDRALELLKQSDKEYQTGYSVYALGNAYQQAGQLNDAIATFERTLQPPNLSISWEPQQRWLEARLTLALDYAARGDRQRARETLESFLNLWKDADAGLPLLKKANAEHAKLE